VSRRKRRVTAGRIRESAPGYEPDEPDELASRPFAPRSAAAVEELHFRTSLDDISDLLVRRVQERVEKRLLRRYSWIGTIVVILGSGGSYFVLERAGDDPAPAVSGAGVGTPRGGVIVGNASGSAPGNATTVDGPASEGTFVALGRVDSVLARIEMTERRLERLGAELVDVREEMRRTVSEVGVSRKGQEVGGAAREGEETSELASQPGKEPPNELTSRPTRETPNDLTSEPTQELPNELTTQPTKELPNESTKERAREWKEGWR